MVSVAPGVTVQVAPPSRPAVVAAPPAVVQVQVTPAGGPASLAVQVAPPSHPTVTAAPPAAVSGVQVAPVPGLRGPTGLTGGTAYTYVQSTPVASWPVAHNLGRDPAAVLLIVGGSVVETDVDLPDINTVVLTFAQPTSGRVDII